LNSSQQFLGIDTGGTFTDGVLFNPATHEVVKAVKALTTHSDLKQCVLMVLEQLIPADPAMISLVSLSTTLATNAVAEGKRKPVALLLLGYDPELVHQFQFQHQFGTPHYFFVRGRHDFNGLEVEALDEETVRRIGMEYREKVEAFAVSSYYGPLNAEHEERAGSILRELSGLPVVQAHHLSSELDSIRRATTASLNASLLSNLTDFIHAVEQTLIKSGVTCPLMMVRGEGSIMRVEYARHRPVEMIHSGPATSAIGGQYLSGVDHGLVIDMGGTTTDIALVSNGMIQVDHRAATVGAYRTCIRTIKSRSVGLGGDSRITFDHWGNLSVGPERVIPFSRFCALNPQARTDIYRWIDGNQSLHYSEKLEYWVLRREPRYVFDDEKTNRIIQLLRERPHPFWVLRDLVGPIAPVLVRELIDLEVIERVGFTPTDLLHASGELSLWDGEIARQVVVIAAKLFHEPADALIDRVREMITQNLAAEIVQFLGERKLSDPANGIKGQGMDRWLFEQSVQPTSDSLGCRIFLKMPVIGIGAPAKILLPEVARKLGTEIIFPDHFEVANAVGTVVGNILIRQEGEVFPYLEGNSVAGYFARAANTQVKLDRFEDALICARERLIEAVSLAAIEAGAENPAVECEETHIWDGMVRLKAWAIGKPGSG